MDFEEVIKIADETVNKTDDYDDSFIDRLHNRYTVALILCFCIAISTYQYVDGAIKCWVPPELADNYQDYIDHLCFIQNTYYISKSENSPRNIFKRHERSLKYYQWIYLILLIQALLFLLPQMLWQSFNHSIGIPIRSLIRASNRFQLMISDKKRKDIIKYISNCLQRYEEYIDHHNSMKIIEKCRLFFQARTGASLVYFYTLIKILYLINLIFQMCFLQYFLSYHQISYFQFASNMLINFYFSESQLFPRITLCDFQIRELNNQHLYSAECILTINIFLEKIYFLLWIWFSLLFCLTTLDFLDFIYRIYFCHSRKYFLRQHFELLFEKSFHRHREYQYFLRYFPIDSLFTLKLIETNSNSMIVADILEELFQRQIQNDSNI